MAEPIPAADAALLAAQAQGGQAAVEAYKAAKLQLEQQKAQAVQRAMAEAALRGTPYDAAQSTQATITGPYDQRIAALTAGAASLTGDMAARAQRSTDYNNAVGSARGLIPGMVEQAVAPIRARADFDLSQIDRQSAGKVAQIDAERRLVEARAAAAAQLAALKAAAGGGRGGGGSGGSGKAKTMNQSETRSSLVEGARNRVSEAREVATKAVREAGEQQRLAASYAGNAAQYDAVQAAIARSQGKGQTPVNPNAAANESARQAAAYTGRALQEAQSQARPAMVTPLHFQGTQVSGGQFIPEFGQDAVRAANAALERARRQLAEQVELGRREQEQAAEAARRAPAPRSLVTPVQARELALNLAPGYLRGMLTPEQQTFIGGAGEGIASYLFGDQIADGRPRPIFGTEDVDEILGGALNRDTAQQNPIARQAFRDAMILEAGRLQEAGFDLPDEAILEAIGSDEGYDVGDTFLDVEARSAGGRGLSDQYERDLAADEAAQRRADIDARGAARDEERYLLDQDEAEAEAVDEALRSEFYRRWGIPLTDSLGPRDDVVEMTSSPGFDQAVQAFEQATGGQVPSAPGDINAVLDQAGVRDPIVRRLIREIYGNG